VEALTSRLKLGAWYVYEPASGRISVEYKNLSQEPVTIDVYRIQRICDAEACQFLDGSKNGLVSKVDEFKAIATTKDGSYPVISGVAESGRPFRIHAVWWTDDKVSALVNRSPCINRYLDKLRIKSSASKMIATLHAPNGTSLRTTCSGSPNQVPFKKFLIFCAVGRPLAYRALSSNFCSFSSIGLLADIPDFSEQNH
jgi:hypothetical protein